MWFEFILTTECNWNCPYCTFDRVDNSYATKEKILEHQYIFDLMKKIDNVTVVCEGGEIGLIQDNDLLEFLFRQINIPVIINTNGLFFESDRTILYPYIDKVFYHIAPDTKKMVKVEPLDVPFEVVYGIVDDDIEQMNKFVEYNSHLNIEYQEYEYISKLPMDTTKSLSQQIACKTLNPFVCIDLSREVLQPCSARGSHVTIPLTEKNLINVLTKYNNFEYNDMCDTCYRMSTNNNILDVMKRKKQLGGIL